MKICIITIIYLIFSLLLADITHKADNTGDMNRAEDKALTGKYADRSIIRATPDDAKQLISEAFEYLDLNGTELTYEEINKRSGIFRFKDTYIFAIDMNGNVLAHGGDIQLVGTNQYQLKDSVGRYFIQEFIALMTEEDEGWIKYKWRNYESFEIESKLTYLKKYNNNLFLGCGIYYGK